MQTPAPEGSARARPHSPLAIAFTLAGAHFVTDVYAAFLHPLLPRIMVRLDLSITLAATLAMTLSLATSVLQPFMGWMADRYGRRVFVALGPLLSATFLSLMGLADTLPMLLLVLALGGLGAASFHPPGASLAARAMEGRGSGMRLAYFSFGGSLGFAAGPLVAVALVARVGLEGLWIAMVPGVLTGLALLWLLPPRRSHRARTRPPSPQRVLAHLRGPLGLVFGVAAAGAFIQRVFLTMAPIANAQAGGAEAAGAVMLSVYLGGQATGSLAGGWLTDRVDRRRLLVGLTLGSLPAHLLALGLPTGSAALAAAFVAGLLNMAMLPPIVVVAQEILPEGSAVVSGVVMGLAWATASVAVLGTGALGDLLGARAAALVSVPLILLGTALALHPALKRHRHPYEPVAR